MHTLEHSAGLLSASDGVSAKQCLHALIPAGAFPLFTTAAIGLHSTINSPAMMGCVATSPRPRRPRSITLTRSDTVHSRRGRPTASVPRMDRRITARGGGTLL
eukprot:scaffold261432_cov32-Tisochrysis_lutea.AAC.1